MKILIFPILLYLEHFSLSQQLRQFMLQNFWPYIEARHVGNKTLFFRGKKDLLLIESINNGIGRMIN